MHRHLNEIDVARFTTEEADDFHVQADMTRQVIDYVRVNRLPLNSAAKLFKLQESTLAQILKGQLGVLSDDELGDIINQILVRPF